MMTRLLIATLIVLSATACSAETRVWVQGVPFICDGYHQTDCRKDWRTINRQKVKQPEVRSWRQEEAPRHDCRPVISVVGTEHLTEANAKDAAERAWRDQVRYMHGERFMNLEKSHRMKIACTRSSTGDSTAAKVLEKLSDTAGVLTRCQIEARPCSVEPEEIGK